MTHSIFCFRCNHRKGDHLKKGCITCPMDEDLKCMSFWPISMTPEEEAICCNECGHTFTDLDREIGLCPTCIEDTMEDHS